MWYAFAYVVRICVSAYLPLQQTPRLCRYQANESKSLPGSVGMVCSNCTYPADGLRTCFMTGMTIRWKPVDYLPQLCSRMWYVFAYPPICSCKRLLASAGIRPTKAKACLVLLVWCVPIVTTLMMCNGLVSRRLCTRMWYVFAYRPFCTAPALLASSGIRPTKAKACLVLLAWFVPIVPTLMMGYGLFSW